MPELPTPPEDDLSLMRRVGRRAGRGVSREAAVRVAWVCVRRWGDPGAGERLAACLGEGVGADEARELIRTVRAADLASSTPAASSAEFVWRHPGLVAGDAADGEDAEAPEPGRGTLRARVARALRGGRRSG